MNNIINTVVMGFVGFANNGLMPFMLLVFFAGIAMRALTYYTVRRELWFVREFEKRVYSKLETESRADRIAFYTFLRRMLEKTYYEVFELRARYKRRNPDYIMSLGDRFFLIQDGAARLIGDTLKYLKYHERKDKAPEMIEISKNVFNTNPAFSRVFGIIPSSVCNTLIDMLPGLFIIGGIFGTFIGIMNALPQLSGMDLANAEQTKKIMDAFLVQMAYALVTSILGVILSVSTNIFNSVCDPEGLFITIVDRYSSALTVLWNRCAVEPGTTFYEETEDDFETDEEQDAHEALQRQLHKKDAKLTWRDGKTVPHTFQPEAVEDEDPAPSEDSNDQNHKKSA